MNSARVACHFARTLSRFTSIIQQLIFQATFTYHTGMATVHPSRMRMVPQSRPPPPPRRSPTPPPRSREEELKLKLLAKRKQQQPPESSGLKIKGSSKQDTEEPLADIYRDRGSAEPGPSTNRSMRDSSGMHGWDDRDGDNYRRRSRSRSRQDDRYPRNRSRSRSRDDDTYVPRRSDSRDRFPPRYDDRYRPRSRSRETRPPPQREGRNDRQPPPHLPPFPPKWDQNLPPPIAPPIRLGFGGPGPAGLPPGQGQGQGYQPGPGPRGHGGNGFRQGGAVDFERSVLSHTFTLKILIIGDAWRGRIIHCQSGHHHLKVHIGMTSKLLPLCSREDRLIPRDPLQKAKKKSKKSKSKRHRRYSDESDSTDSEAEERRRRKRRERRRKEYSDEERGKSDDSEDDRERRKRRTKSRSKSALSPAPGKTDWIEKEKSGVATTTITADIQSDSDDGEMVGPSLPAEYKDKARKQAYVVSASDC